MSPDPTHSTGQDRRRLLGFLAASPLLSAAGIDLDALHHLVGRDPVEGGWRLMEEVEAGTRAHAPRSLFTAQQPPPIRSADEALAVMDFEPAARSKLPPAHWGYLAGGVDDDRTLQANREGFAHLQLRARRLVNVRDVDTSLTVLGERWSAPLFVCPTSGQRMCHDDGELATARAARAQGLQLMLSGVTTTAVEEVNAAYGRPVWYQLYPTDVDEVAHAILRRADRANCPVLILTVDLNGGRNSETQARFVPLDNRTCTECHAPGLTGYARRKKMFDGLDISRITTLENAAMDWQWVRRCRAVAPRMKLVLKGIVTREDAALAVQHGADAIVVSNHGGRAEESGRATIESLPEVVAAVGGRIPVLLDGGIRRGTDMLKALALGATAVGIGRPYLWGLSAFGQPGVEAVLTILRREFTLAMRQMGVRTVRQLGPSYVVRRSATR